jgi:2-phospho-L-lactate transferase/gluconeogenesis factor (CofD/UPF0052 family)/FMN phosphatase YigB (HAD superfamily)
MKNTRAVIFDLDGTLFDLAPLVQAARNRVATLLHSAGFFASTSYALKRINELEDRHGPYYSSSPYYFAFFDIAKSIYREKSDACTAFLRTYGHDSGDPIEQMVTVLEQSYNAEDVENISPYPDAVQTLEELRAAGCKNYLVSIGRPGRQKNKIDRLGIAPLFDRIINEGPPSHVYWFNEILDDGYAPDEVVVVGDRSQDEIRSGNRLGLTTVWMKRGRYGEVEPGEGDRPDYEVGFLSQVSTLVHLARAGKDREHFKTVVIGGGTGLPTVLRGIRTFDEKPTAIVAVTDTGASSGRIRWNLGVQPPGDIRNALTALADPDRVSPGLFRVFQHRFPNDEAEAGIFKNDHIGNFLVAALTQQLGNFQHAIETASEMLHVKGTILPACLDNVDICAELENGEHRYTEWMVRKPDKPALKRAYMVSNAELLAELDRKDGSIRRVEDPATGQVEVHGRKGAPFAPSQKSLQAPAEAVTAIQEADLVILGPGSLYTSVITNLLVPGIRKALLSRSNGKTCYVCNITTQPGQSDGFKASDHVKTIASHLKKATIREVFDYVLVQDTAVFDSDKGKAWAPLLRRYEKDEKILVQADEEELDQTVEWARADFVEEFSPDMMGRGVGDFISHDSNKVADALCRVYCGLPIPDYWGLHGKE